MTGKAAAFQGGLAALGLITAHLTWQREPERAPGEVTLIDAGKNDVGKIHFDDDGAITELERRKDGGDAAVWVHLVERRKLVPPADHKPTASDPPVYAPTNPPRDLHGSDVAGKVLDQFAPLRSARAFGILDAAKLKELGLDKPKRKLTVVAKGDTREYTIGQPPGPTTGAAFLRDSRDGRVYLMPSGLLGDLTASTRLVDRKLHTFEPIDFSRLVVTLGGKSRELLQTHRETPQTAQLASPKTPDKADQMAKNWHDLLWRSFPLDVLGKDETPKDGKPTPALRVEYFDGGKSLGYIELAETTDNSAQQTDPSGNRTSMYARTEHTAGWVKLHVNGSLTADAEKIVAAGP